MQSAQIQLHARFETKHWWFVGRRRILHDLVHEILSPSPNATIVDVGCGTGANIASLTNQYRCVGIDISSEAIELAKSRFPETEFICGRAPRDLRSLIPEVQLLMLLDVLEHVEDDFTLLSELVTAVRPGTHLLVTVPADALMYGPHDQSFGHYRRYDKEQLETLWSGLPVSVRMISYFNTRLYRAIKGLRAWNQWRQRSLGEAATDFQRTWGPLNRWLAGLLAGEANVLVDLARGKRDRGYSRGVSLVALLRREADPIAPGTASPDQVGPETEMAVAAPRRGMPEDASHF